MGSKPCGFSLLLARCLHLNWCVVSGVNRMNMLSSSACGSTSACGIYTAGGSGYCFEYVGDGYCQGGGDDLAGDSSREACEARCGQDATCLYYSCKDESSDVDCMLYYTVSECDGANGGSLVETSPYVTYAKEPWPP